MANISTTEPAAFILDLPHSSLSVMRSLGKRGIEVYGINTIKGAIGTFSKYCQVQGSKKNYLFNEELLERMIAFSSNKGILLVLYCLSDEAVEFVNRYRDELSKHYLFQLAEFSIIDKILSKTKTVSLLNEIGIDAPRSFVLRSSNLHEVSSELNYPLVLKLAKQKSWKFDAELMKEYIKVKLVKNEQELRYWFNILIKYDSIAVQEFIPGSSENQFYATIYNYSELESDTAVFIGKKLRVSENGFGSETYYQSVQNVEIKKICLDFVKKTNYVGFAGIDFKYDSRDGTYKVIEINPRLGVSDGLAIECGLDIPYYYFQYQTKQPFSISERYTLNKKWLWLLYDFETYFKNPRGESIIKWLVSILRGEKCYLLYDSTDMKPLITEYKNFFNERVLKFRLKKFKPKK